MQKKKSGVTLVEVMCAMYIIASLALIVIPDIRLYVANSNISFLSM